MRFGSQIVRTGIITVSSDLLNILYASDSLEPILSHPSTRLTNVIGTGHCLEHLNYLLESLGAWEKRHMCLTHQWYRTISEAAARLRPGGVPISQVAQELLQLQLPFRTEPQDLALDPLRPHSHLQEAALYNYGNLLRKTLKIEICLAGPGPYRQALHPDHASHNDRVFETAFSSDDDEIIADAVCAWIADSGITSPGSFTHYFADRVENVRTFSKGYGGRAHASSSPSGAVSSRYRGWRLFAC